MCKVCVDLNGIELNERDRNNRYGEGQTSHIVVWNGVDHTRDGRAPQKKYISQTPVMYLIEKVGESHKVENERRR